MKANFRVKLVLGALAFALEKASNLPPFRFVCLRASLFYAYAIANGIITNKTFRSLTFLTFNFRTLFCPHFGQFSDKNFGRCAETCLK